ncbi:phage head closure protein [Pseudomonas sp. GD03842]|uniref:phage head closure protein n=1 Tax=Pseudomonas sp. GD03842 TaxID=2975385 RepID=UPI00244CC278|nr:phage head closure protein [Pseudomonas sp. GD03842]MDH0745735.1 phage head closure protein [Pseudomonas sp. GD03842]
MRAGDLRHRVTFERKVTTNEPGSNAEIVTWVEFVTVWAAIKDLSVREFIAALSTQSEVTCRIVTRYRDGFTADMRARHDGKIYNLHGVLRDPTSGKEYLTFPASEGVNDG